MTRKRLVFFVLMATVLSHPVVAQQNTPDPQAVLDRLAKVSQALQLTADQKQQVLPILRMEAPQIQQVMNDPNLIPQQRASQLKQIAADVDGKIQPILTQQQWQKWQDMRRQERQAILQKSNQ